MAALNAPAAALDRVTLRYGLRPVLKGVSLSFRQGEVVGLIGPGGGGKSQLLKVLSTLRTPWEGTVTLFNRRVDAWHRHGIVDVRANIGLQFQNFALFDSLDVWDNVAFSLVAGRKLARETASPEVGRALEEVGLAPFAHSLPSELSGGMRRRVAIARVVAARPALALFDDPVAGLDPVNSARIMALIGSFARSTGATTVVATHDIPRLLPICTRLVALFDGKVLYDGPAAEVDSCESEIVRRFVESAREGTR